MIPSVVTHVREKISSHLEDLLDNSYIINVLLKEYESDVSKSFIDTYVNQYTYDSSGNPKRVKDGEDILVTTNYPEDMATQKSPLILVGLGEGRETTTSLGLSEGDYTYTSTGYFRESIPAKLTEEGVVLTTSNAIGGSVEINTMSIDDKYVSFNDNIVTIDISKESLNNLGISEGTPIDVSYEVLENSNYGSSQGFFSEETVQVVVISNNLDTIRILDSLLKVITILMKQEDNEKTTYQLGTIAYSAVSPVDSSVPVTPNILFGRQIDITYTVSYWLDKRSKQYISKLLYSSDMPLEGM